MTLLSSTFVETVKLAMAENDSAKPMGDISALGSGPATPAGSLDSMAVVGANGAVGSSAVQTSLPKMKSEGITGKLPTLDSGIQTRNATQMMSATNPVPGMMS